MNKRYTMKMGLLAAFVLFIAAGFYNPKLVKAAELQNEETAVLQKGDSVYNFWQYTVYRNQITITKYTGAETEVTVPGSINGLLVTTVGRRAFEGNEFLLSVTIPDSVLTVGNGAFRNCVNLRNVNGMASVTSIDSEAFQNCSSLTSVSFGSALKSIGYQSFRDCVSLAECRLPASITSLGTSCFRGSGLVSVAVPANITLYDRAFQECQKLERVTIGANIALESYLFNGCTSLREAVVQEGDAAIYIDNYAFLECTALERVVLPSNVRAIGYQSFYKCQSLNTLDLSYGLIGISDSAFRYCDSLGSVDIPNSVTDIGNFAFANCAALESLTIPNSVVTIGRSVCDQSTVIKCYPGSAAEQYAQNNGLTAEPLEAVFSTSVSFPEPTVYMEVGDIKRLNCILSPSNTTDAVVWQSSNTQILAINAIGEMEAKKAGSVTVIATATSGLQGRVNIVVSDSPRSITFSRSSYTILPGETVRQIPSIRDTSGNLRPDLIPVYTSSNPAIASVATDGTVTGISAGQVTITAKIKNVSASYQVTVAVKGGGSTPSVQVSLSFAKALKKVVIGQSFTQKATVSGATNVVPVYASSNPKVAKVTNTGKVTGLKEGTVTITATAGNVRTAYTVKVETAQATASGKTLKITTIPKAKVTVKANKSMLGSSSKKAVANKKGAVKIKFKKKIKGKVKITIQKSGYKKKTINKKF